MKFLLSILLTFLLPVLAQCGTIKGIVKSKKNNEPLVGALVFSGSYGAYSGQDGEFLIDNFPAGESWLHFRYIGYRQDSVRVVLENSSSVVILNDVLLEESADKTSGTVIISDYFTNRPAQKMQDVDGTVINAGKKNDVVVIGQTEANLALSNARQVLARVPGINVWENDGTGTGISIAARGLSPNRSWEFNTRQNGYDIASDPVGYPEAYYAPPLQGVDRIEILRGAAALQYGSQFGGMVNYRMRRGPIDKKIAGEISLTGGNYGLFDSYAGIGGTTKKVNYYAFYTVRRSDGWRENTGYFTNTGYASAEFKLTEKLKLGVEFTGLYYLLQQPGGLTDSLFAVNARESFRERNWFEIRWNMPAFTASYEHSENLLSTVKIFALDGERNSTGYTGAANTNDNMGQRTVDRDYYTNIGGEWRTAWHYKLIGGTKSTLSFGLRYFKGNTLRKQGKGTDGSDAVFIFADPDNLSRDLELNAENTAVFAENLFRIGKKLSISPGMRYEWIRTYAAGKPAVQAEGRKYEFPLFGIAAEYDLPYNISLYGNWSQSFRPVTFNELWTSNSSITVDKNLKAANGWSSDLGVRGSIRNGLYYDISSFYLVVEGRIGEINATDENGNTYLLRTNTGNSINQGAEAYVDVHPFQLLKEMNKAGDFGLFCSAAYLEAYYSKGPSEGKRVEYAPRWTVRSGLSWQYKFFSTTFTWSYTDNVYSDSKNTISSANGATGWIHSYNVLDWSFTAKLPHNLAVKGSVNNIADHRYFTRRAGGYPGPGLIPAEARTLTIGISWKI